jgi:hypothetical protein
VPLPGAPPTRRGAERGALPVSRHPPFEISAVIELICDTVFLLLDELRAKKGGERSAGCACRYGRRDEQMAIERLAALVLTA